MKTSLAVAVFLTLAGPFGTFGAEKPTVPPKKELVPAIIPPVSDPTNARKEPTKLITSEMSGRDLQFFKAAVDAGRLQAYLVELLKDKAVSDQIKALGGALAATQEQENKQIARLAEAKGWAVSMEPTAKERAFGVKLQKEDSASFDKAIMDKVVASAQQAVSAYETAAQSEDKEIKEFGTQMLPLAQEKLKYAEKMTGADKSATQLFRKTVPSSPTPAPSSTPTPAPAASAEKPGAKPMPPAIIPSKTKP